ncbi:hypothetical protein GCM10011368_29350 [Hyunsoonleella pacifica]|nr:hypothetical protein GCM10011368_29350 [Hyunsoonleella pacifica]
MESNTLIPNTQSKFDSDKIFPSLEVAHDSILNSYGTNIGSNLTIHIRGGVYYQKAIFWKTTSNNFIVKIINYNNEKVIFDGTDSDGTLHLKFISLAPINRRTNFWLEGLIIQNYVNAISLGQTSLSTDCKYIETIQNSHNTIKNNIFKNIGGKYTTEQYTTEDGIVKDVNGFSALGLSNSTNNTIESNVFYRIENKEDSEVAIHAMYIVNFSNNNLIKDNYISLCDKSPIKLRNACNNNVFERNYIEQSGNAYSNGNTGFFEAWYCNSGDDGDITDCNGCYDPIKDENGNPIEDERNKNRIELPSTNNQLFKNVCTFPYPDSNTEITLHHSKWGNDTFVDIDNFVIGTHPECEEISATTSGDINGDGKDETFVAYNYDNFTKLVRTRPETPHYLSKVLYKSKFWHIGALEMNNFINGETPELITAFNALTSNKDNTQIYMGDGVNSVSNFGKLYSHVWWRTAAITSGDYDNSGSNEIFTAFNAPNDNGDDNTQIFKGTGSGVNPISNLTSNGSHVYNHPWWLTKSITSGDFDGDGYDELYIAYNAPDTTGNDNTQIFKGTGTGAHPLGYGESDKKFNHAWWQTAAMTTGDFNGNGSDDIVIAYNAPDNDGSFTTQIYRGNGDNAISNYGKLYEDFGWRTGALISGQFDLINGDELKTTLFTNTSSQSYTSQGTGAISTLGQYHRTDNITPCNQNLSARRNTSNNILKPLKEKNTILIYPNPISKPDGFTISGTTKDYKIEIFSSVGELVMFSQNEKNIETKNLAAGLYIVKITDSSKTEIKKVIIK